VKAADWRNLIDAAVLEMTLSRRLQTLAMRQADSSGGAEVIARLRSGRGVADGCLGGRVVGRWR
jgi:hypothetical protein